MPGLPQADYLRLRQRTRELLPETEVVSDASTLFEIDKFRRMSGRSGTQAGERVRETLRRNTGGQDYLDFRSNEMSQRRSVFNSRLPRDPRAPGGALGLDVSGNARAPEDMPVPVRPGRSGGSPSGFFNRLGDVVGPILSGGLSASASVPSRGDGDGRVPIPMIGQPRVGDVQFNPDPFVQAGRSIGEAFTAPNAGIGLTRIPTIEKNREVAEALGDVLQAADSPLVTGSGPIEELSRPSTAAIAAVPGIALGGRGTGLGTRFALEAGQGLVGRGAANAASERLEGAPGPVQAGGSLLAGLIAAGMFNVTAVRGLSGKPVPLGMSIEDVDDPLRPHVDELKGVLREELDFRVSGTADVQRTAGRAAQFGSRREALEEASRRGLRGEQAERFARSAMEGRLFEDRASRISPQARQALIEGVHLAERAGAIPNHVGIRLTTALDKAGSGIRLEPAELRLIGEYTGDKELVDALIALNGTAAASRSALNRPAPPRKGPPPVRPSGSSTPATGRVPNRTTAGRVAEQSSRERARELARQAQEEARRLAQEAADRRKNIPKPPPNRGVVSGGRGGNRNVPNIDRIAAQARDRARKPVFGPKRPPTIGENFVDFVNLPRSLASSHDISAPYRQGGVLSARNPHEFYASWGPMLRAFTDEDFARQFNESLTTGQMGIIRERAGVFRATLDGAMSQREEAAMSRLATIVPGVDASQRSYVTFLNGLRADVFDKNYVRLVESGLKGPELDKAAQELAQFVNWATGRGNLSGGQLLNVLNGIFFSPRLLKSRFDVMRSVLPKNLGGNIENDVVRQIARENVASWVAQNLTVMGMIRLTTNTLADGSLVSVELDPRSSDWMKLRIGNTRYDPWAGFQPLVRSAVQYAMGERKTASGKIIDANRADVALSFARTKTSPPIGAFIDLNTGETLIGEPIDSRRDQLKTIGSMFMPLSLQDLHEGFEEAGIVGAASTLPAMIGFGVTTFSTITDVRDEVAQDRFGVSFEELDTAEKKRAVLNDERVIEKSRSEQFGRDNFTSFSDDIRAEQAAADDKYRETLDYREWKNSTDARKNQLIGARLVQFGDEPIKDPDNAYEEFINVVREHKLTATEFDWDEIDAWRATLSPEENAFIDANSGLRDTDFQFARRKVLSQMDERGFFDIRDRVWERVASRFDLGTFETYEAFQEETTRRLRERLLVRGVSETEAPIMAREIFDDLPPVKAWSEISNGVEQVWIEQNPELAADAIDLAALDWSRLRNAELEAALGRR